MSRKKIEYYHFSPVLKKQEVLQCMKRLETFDQRLGEVLSEELANGNQIISVIAGLPEKGAVSVNLKYPFIDRTIKEGVVYSALNDAHYGNGQYTSTQSEDSIFC